MALFPSNPKTEETRKRRPFIAHRADKNQPAIVNAFRQMGCSVQHLHMVGQGCPDILVGYRGKNYLFEIKRAHKNPKKLLTKREAWWHEHWRGQVMIVVSPEDAIAFVMQLRQAEGVIHL